jgi:hypothetical protein
MSEEKRRRPRRSLPPVGEVGEEGLTQRYYTQLAVGLLFPSVQKILEAIGKRDYETAYTLLLAFVNLHPRTVREEVLKQVDENEAEELAKKEVVDLYGVDSFEDLINEAALKPAALAELYARKNRIMVLRALEALGEAWERHGLVWFAGFEGYI